MVAPCPLLSLETLSLGSLPQLLWIVYLFRSLLTNFAIHSCLSLGQSHHWGGGGGGETTKTLLPPGPYWMLLPCLASFKVQNHCLSHSGNPPSIQVEPIGKCSRPEMTLPQLLKFPSFYVSEVEFWPHLGLSSLKQPWVASSSLLRFDCFLW